jgi:fructokinase
MTRKKLIIFGEVLFDCFPNGEKILGGAPFNVAWHLQAFGQSPYFVSCIGQDAEGAIILEAMKGWGMETEGVQLDGHHPTGKVAITLNQGEPSYEIVADSAYDFIDPARLETIVCDTLYHGSLGLRNSVARSALSRLKRNGTQRVFLDINLRPPWWQREEVLEWVSQADWVKLNQHELEVLLGQEASLPTQAEAFKSEHGLDGLIITRGERGASLSAGHGSTLEVVPEKALKTVDTVGAGDAFTAVILLGLMSEWPFDISLKRAQSFASAIVGQRGATVSSPDFYRHFITQWGL